MRLVAVEISPQGNAILITGKNAAGKSSVLDAIMAVFCGKKYQPTKPIRDGEDHAEVVVETENYIIKRTFTASGGGTVTVSNAEGMKASSPQGLLDKLVGEIAFEPMAFYKDSRDVKRQRQQRDTLMKLVGLDFADIDREIADVKTQRSAVKNSKETYELEANQIPQPDNMPEQEISLKELTEKLTAATQHNEKQAEVGKQISDAANYGTSLKEKLEENKELIANLKQQLLNAEKAQIEGENKFEAFRIDSEKLVASSEPVIDVAAINKEIEEADTMNEHVRLTNQRKELLKKSAAKSREFAELGKKMKELEAGKVEKLAAVKMPIEGLSVNEVTILYNNIPLAQVNDSMQLQIAVAISMALNPKLRVILMKGNDLDSANLETICKMAKEKDYQVWIEKVSDDKKNKTGFIIEDGSVVPPDAGETLFSKKDKAQD